MQNTLEIFGKGKIIMEESKEQRAKSKERNAYLDFVKGIAIFLVVFGHCIQYGNGRDFVFFGDTFFKIIYSFHMPLFALVSGYLFFGSASRKNPRELFTGQVKILVVPAMFWPFLFHFFENLLMRFSGFDPRIFLRMILFSSWFLWAMFWSSLSVIAARKFFHDNVIFYLVVIFLSMIVPSKHYNLSLYFFVYPYFIAGYLWRRESLDEKFNMLPKNKKFLAGSCVIILWYVMLLFFNYDSYVYTTGMSIINHAQKIFIPSQLWNDLFRWAIGFVGSAAVLLVLKAIRPVKLIILVGMRSLGIYIISGYIQTRVLPDYGGYAINFLEAVIITFVCYWLSVLISKNKITNKFLLGGR